MTEFALVAPILFALAFGIFDFGRGMSANVTITNSSREGARYLAAHATSWPSTEAAPSLTSGRFNTSCYGVGASPSAPVVDSPQGKAWVQLQAANLDLSAVTMTIRFYKDDGSSDPVSNGVVADTITCSGGDVVESTSSYTPESGDWVQFEVKYHYAPVTPIISNLVHSILTDQTTTMVLE